MATEYIYNGDPIITNFYKTSPLQLEVLLYSAIEAVSNKRAELVYNFYPPELELLALAFGEKITNYITKMNISISAILTTLSTTFNEEKFMNIVGENVYIFIKYTILTTKLYFSITKKLFSPIENSGQLLQFKMIHNSSSELKFSGNPTKFLFHGSGFENWYNIFRIGLKTTSGANAKLLVNANVYGPGIYLSDNPVLSLGYCHSKTGINDKYILAICEVHTDAAIKKSNNIFLITDETKILLRYIIYFDKIIYSDTNFKKQLDMILDRLHTNKINSAAYHRRLAGELKRVQLNNDNDFIITPICNDAQITTHWKIKFINYNNQHISNILVHQLHKYEIKSVDIEFIFGSKFPYSPPFMRLVYPRLEYNPDKFIINPDLAFIDKGGGICTSIFKTDNWTPSYPLINLINDIKCMLFMTEGLEIAKHTWNIPYTEHEALINFNNIIGTFELEDAIDLLDAQ